MSEVINYLATNDFLRFFFIILIFMDIFIVLKLISSYMKTNRPMSFILHVITGVGYLMLLIFLNSEHKITLIYFLICLAAIILSRVLIAYGGKMVLNRYENKHNF